MTDSVNILKKQLVELKTNNDPYNLNIYPKVCLLNHFKWFRILRTFVTLSPVKKTIKNF